MINFDKQGLIREVSRTSVDAVHKIAEEMGKKISAENGNIKRIVSVVFSPTGQTATVCKRAALIASKKLGVELKEVKITSTDSRKEKLVVKRGELLVIAFPTYAGRLPNKILSWFENLKGEKDSLGIAITTFGNRNPGSSLVELVRLLEDRDIEVIGASTMVCRHAFSDEIGEDRPSERDLKSLDELVDLACKVGVNKFYKEEKNSRPYNEHEIREIEKDKIKTGKFHDINEIKKAEIMPYYIPKKTDGSPAKFLKAKPVTDKELCTDCKRCVGACPMGSISFDNVFEVPGICIKCQGCIRICPEGAKAFDDEDFLSHVEMLKENLKKANISAYYI